jgi:phosphate:Na+ symporter
VRALLVALTSDLLLDILVGAVLAVLSYSSLAIVLLTATLAGRRLIPVDGGAGPGAGRQPGQRLLAVLTTPSPMCRRARCRWATWSSRSWACSS